MTAERESMTLQEMGAPALGVEERRDEAPRAGASHARPTPDPEVVAKPKRRKFTAQYRLRILEEAESCTQPGEVGRLLRREGLYSSHLTEWRRARREGSLQGLTPSKRGRKPAERNPLSAKVHELEAKWLGWRRSCTPPIRSWTSREKLPGCWDSASNTGRTADGRPAARIAGRRGAGVPSAGGVPRASFYRRQRPAPGHQQPRPTPARALRASERAHVLDVLASPRFVDRSPAEVVATLLDEGRYLCAERTMYRILAANQPVRERRNQRSHPCYTKPELVATGPNQTWSWDITRLRGPKRWDVLLPLCLARHLQPLRRGLDGCRSGERRARRDADRGNLSQARHRAPGAHPAFGPRRADDQQVHRPTPRRPWGHPLSEPPPGQRRQPLLRGAVQDPEVSPRLPWPLRRHYRRHRLLPVVLPLVQHRAPPCRDRDAHPR